MGTVGSDTGSLQDARASRGGSTASRSTRHPTLARLAAGAVFLVLASACNGGGSAPDLADAEAPGEEARARTLLATEAPLPDRAEVVAVADAIAIASSRQGKTPKGGALARLAADLRTRAYRFDRIASDGREALEL